MDEKCCVCGEDFKGQEEIVRLNHVDCCLDKELEKKLEQTGALDNQTYIRPNIDVKIEDYEYDYTGMPDYEHMSVCDLKQFLDDNGLKKSLDSKRARVILKEIWLYVNKKVFPSYLSNYHYKSYIKIIKKLHHIAN